MRIIFFMILGFTCLCLYSQDAPPTVHSAKDLTRGADAIVRLHKMDVQISNINSMTVKMTRRITVFNPSGNKHVRAYVGYDRSIRVKKLEAVIFNVFGQETEKIRERDFRDVSAVGGGTLYTDSRIKYLEYTPVQYPYTLEFRYEIQTSNTGIVPSWYFLEDFRLSTEESIYTILYSSPELKPEFRTLNTADIALEKNELPGSISFVARNIEAIQPEVLSPERRRLLPQVMSRMTRFYYEGYEASATDWQELGKWISANLLKGQDSLPDATIFKVRDLVKGHTDPLEKAKIIYRYVQENTRYISVQVGIGGLKPISAIEVDRLKYGDCKGLSNYTAALLKAVGVTSYYCHVEAGKDKVDFDPDFADLKQGNHAILAVEGPDGMEWIDCTSQTLPFGFLGDFTDDRAVLLITPEGGKIVRTPSYTDQKNYLQTTADMVLGSDGTLKGRVNLISHGIQYDGRIGVQKLNGNEREGFYRSYWSYLNNLRVQTMEFENNPDSIAFSEEVELEATNYSSRSGELCLFNPNAFNRQSHIPEKYQNRELPFEIQRGFLDEDQYTIEVPEGYRVEFLPAPVEQLMDFGEYAARTSYDPETNAITYRRKLYLKAGSYPRESYEAYRDFMIKVASSDNQQVVLIKLL